MGIYVITGATSGIGAKTAEILRERGHEVVNIDLNEIGRASCRERV